MAVDSVRFWAEPARERFGALLEFASPETVYHSYGKVFPLIFAGVLLCALAVRSRRPSGVTRVERWAWRVALVGYALIVLGSVVAYWTPLVTQGFGALIAPGILLGTAASSVLGISLLRSSWRPRLAAALLVASFPSMFLLSDVVLGSLALSLFPMVAAWGVAGLSIRATSTPSDEGVPIADLSTSR